MTVGYFCAIGIALIFMFYMDGGIGVMMLSFLLLMPLLSVLLTLYLRNKLHVTLRLPDSGAKHRKQTVIIRLEKDTVLPMPFLRMELSADAHFAPLNPNAEPLPEKPDADKLGMLRYQIENRRWKKSRRLQLTPDTLPLCLSVGTERQAEYRIPLTPRFCGSGTVTLRSLRLSDYFAMFSMRMNTEAEAQLLIEPEIPELKANSGLFRSVATAVAAADEETDAAPVFSASSMPGYEHRDYIPGDSLKRINWKLSSKRHQLMVRRDEPIALARLSVVLDFRRSAEPMPEAERLMMEEQLTETALGFLMLCAKYGYPCKLCYADAAGEWSTLSIDDGEQLAVEAGNRLRGGFRTQETLGGLAPLPPELMQDSGALLLYFTELTGTEASAAPAQLPTQLYLIVPEQNAEKVCPPDNGSLWFATADRRLIQAGGEAAS